MSFLQDCLRHALWPVVAAFLPRYEFLSLIVKTPHELDEQIAHSADRLVGIERRVQVLRVPAPPDQWTRPVHGKIQAGEGLPVPRRRCRQACMPVLSCKYSCTLSSDELLTADPLHQLWNCRRTSCCEVRR